MFNQGLLDAGLVLVGTLAYMAWLNELGLRAVASRTQDVDLGSRRGRVVALPELQWQARSVPHFDYLLQEPRRACVLAGGHCVPGYIPAPERLVWHKLYSSANRRQDLAKSAKDLVQAATLVAALVEDDPLGFVESAGDVPAQVRKAARRRLAPLRKLLAAHPQALEEVESASSAGS